MKIKPGILTKKDIWNALNARWCDGAFHTNVELSALLPEYNPRGVWRAITWAQVQGYVFARSRLLGPNRGRIWEYQKREAGMVPVAKSDPVCADCGETGYLKQDPNTSTLLCTACQTFRRKPKKVYEHGDYKKYQKDKCRCDLCRAARSVFIKRYRVFRDVEPPSAYRP